MPDITYSATESAAYLKISRPTFYAWLHHEPELYAYLQAHHTLTQRQLDALALKQRRKPVKPTQREIDAALTIRLEALEQRVEELERARMPRKQEAPPIQASEDTLPPQNQSTGALEGMAAGGSVPARILLADYARHYGIPPRTANDQARKGTISATPVMGKWYLTPEQQEAARRYWGK